MLPYSFTGLLILVLLGYSLSHDKRLGGHIESFSARLTMQAVICFTHNGVYDGMTSITSATVQLQTQMLRTPNLQTSCEILGGVACSVF